MTSTNLPDDLSNSVAHALREDLGPGDITAALIDPQLITTATLIARQKAILCGAPWFDEVFRQVDPTVEVNWLADEGCELAPNQTVCRIHGKAISILSAERTALNFLQTLSGTATLTRRYQDAVAPFKVRILDTRKTIPGLRTAQKYAVRTGGGTNHRMGLYDGVLVKENHQYISHSVKELIERLSPAESQVELVEVEIEALEELEAAIASGASRVMLDNFSLTDIARAVQQNNQRVELEASGNIDLDTIEAVAKTGVDFISVGAITKHLQAVDYSLQFEKNVAR